MKVKLCIGYQNFLVPSEEVGQIMGILGKATTCDYYGTATEETVSITAEVIRTGPPQLPTEVAPVGVPATVDDDVPF
jgi:hypothetical protein